MASTEGKMGFWKRLWGYYDRAEPIDQLQGNIERSATLLSASIDKELWLQAHRAKNHISLKAVNDEYDRLILEKYTRS
jgi:hypothetical protein